MVKGKICPKCKKVMDYVEICRQKTIYVVFDFLKDEYRDEEPPVMDGELVFCPHCDFLLGEDGVENIKFKEAVG